MIRGYWRSMKIWRLSEPRINLRGSFSCAVELILIHCKQTLKASFFLAGLRTRERRFMSGITMMSIGTASIPSQDNRNLGYNVMSAHSSSRYRICFAGALEDDKKADIYIRYLVDVAAKIGFGNRVYCSWFAKSVWRLCWARFG